MPIDIPAGTSLYYSSAAHAAQTFTGGGVMYFARSGTPSNMTGAFAAGALQGLTGVSATVSSNNSGLAGLHVGGGGASYYAQVRDFPSQLTMYVNTAMGAFDTHLTVLADAPGGTYPTVIHLNRWSTANGQNIRLYANQNNANGAIILTGGVTNPAGGNAAVTLRLWLDGTNTQNNTLAGTISNGVSPVALDKGGVGKWVLSGDNSFTGGISVTGGTLGVRHNNGLGLAGSGAISVGNGCTLEVGGGVSVTKTAGITVQGTGVGGVGGLRCTDGDNSFAGVVTLAADTTIQVDAGATLTFAAGINYNGKVLTKTGAGRLLVPVATTAAGSATINTGAVQIGYGESKALPGNVSLGASGQLAAQDGGSHYRAVVAGTLTMSAGAQLTFGPPV